MTAYLVEHPPARKQFNQPRTAKPTGLVVVHTAESDPDTVGPDTGAENVARFIQQRSTPGSYHDLADSDSTINLVPYTAEAFGDGTGSNPFAYHVSAATQAAKWPTLPEEWKDETVRNMAQCSARFARWIKKVHGIDIPARRVSKAESDRGMAGFISHGERDPGRRSDPGATFPWDDFLRYYKQAMGPAIKPTPKWDAIVENADALLARRDLDPGKRARAKTIKRLAKRWSTKR